MDTTMDRDTLGAKLLPELQQIAQGMGVEGAQKLRKAGLIDAIVAASTNGGDATKPTRVKRNGAATADAAPVPDAPAVEADVDDDEDQEADEGNRAPAREERAESVRQRSWQPGPRQPGSGLRTAVAQDRDRAKQDRNRNQDRGGKIGSLRTGRHGPRPADRDRQPGP